MFSIRKSLVYFQSVIICLCFAWLYTQIDWAAVWLSMEELSLASLGLLSVIFAQRFTPWVLLSFRLQQVFEKQIPYKECFKAATLCVGINVIIPARLGELVRIFWLKSSSSFSYMRVISGCVVERMLDVSMLLLLSLSFAMSHLHVALILSLSLIMLLGWIALFVFIKNTKYLQSNATSRGVTFWQKHLTALQKSLTHITSWKTLAKLWAWTIGIWTLNYVHLSLIANGLVSLNLSFQELGLLTVAVFFSSALLLVPGGIGIMETTIIAILQLMQVSLHDAAVVAIFVRLFHLLPSVLVGIFALLQSRLQYAAFLDFFRNRKSNFSQNNN